MFQINISKGHVVSSIVDKWFWKPNWKNLNKIFDSLKTVTFSKLHRSYFSPFSLLTFTKSPNFPLTQNPKLLIEQQKFDYDHKFDLFFIIILNLLRFAVHKKFTFSCLKTTSGSCIFRHSLDREREKKAANKKNFLHISTNREKSKFSHLHKIVFVPLLLSFFAVISLKWP